MALSLALLLSTVMYPTVVLGGFVGGSTASRSSLCSLMVSLSSQHYARRRQLQKFLSDIATIRSTTHSTMHHHQQHTKSYSTTTTTTQLYNIYDDWSNDLISSSQSDYTYDDMILPLDIDTIEQCMDELIDSDYGETMFGKHDMPASVGITGGLEVIEVEGPEVILGLTGKFWHRRETVLGKAAMYLNARIPEIQSVSVSSSKELDDFEDVIDEYTGEVVFREDKRSPDFNGDRETMEYQGLDPDARGPFVLSSGGGGSMIRPA